MGWDKDAAIWRKWVPTLPQAAKSGLTPLGPSAPVPLIGAGPAAVLPLAQCCVVLCSLGGVGRESWGNLKSKWSSC